MIPGLDVGWPQGLVTLSDWRQLRYAGRRFAYVRCVEGLGSPDGRWQQNTTGARTAGLAVGAYFPVHPDLDSVAQARDHFRACGALGTRKGELQPWADVELTCRQAPDRVLQAAIAWANEATLLWQRRVAIYTYPSFDSSVLGPGATDGASLAQTDLAMAAYQASPPRPHAPWASVRWWQDSGGQPAPGVEVFRVPSGAPCDTDVFLGDEAAFAAALDPSAG